MDLKILRPRPLRRGLLGIEKLTLFYAALTSVAIVILWPHVSHPVSLLLLQRWLLCGAMIIPYFAYRWYPSRMTKFLRIFYVMALLGYWYPDTYNICSTMPYLDHVFASADQWIFGFQPAEWFSRIFSSRVFSEAFYLGYLSYFPIIVFVTFYAWLRKYQQLEYTTFVIMCSFFLFYTVFLFLPVAGPQFYYPLLSAGQLQGGVFPPVPHDYFVLHPQIQENPDSVGGLFHTCVSFMQGHGERPTAAFPSSHVGISTVILLASRKLSSTLTACLVPFYLLLCFSTVYIGAHYAIDALTGIPCGVAAFYFSAWLFRFRFFHRKPHC